jgi:hypothetical protein
MQVTARLTFRLERAQAAILVAVGPSTAESIRSKVPIEKEFPRERVGIFDWLRALRVHQWLKNLLLFVPLLTAFLFEDKQKVVTMLIAFLAFSLAASAMYVFNDLWDLESDRVHPRKRLRPFASGRIPILQGLLAAAGLLVSGLLLSLAISRGFLLMLVCYLGLTLSYSWFLKEYALIDVLTLAQLTRFASSRAPCYRRRNKLLAARLLFVRFPQSGIGKRCRTDLPRSNRKATAQGRDYLVSDLRVLQPLGIGAALSAVVVFGLFISDSETAARYATPQLLWRRHRTDVLARPHVDQDFSRRNAMTRSSSLSGTVQVS